MSEVIAAVMGALVGWLLGLATNFIVEWLRVVLWGPSLRVVHSVESYGLNELRNDVLVEIVNDKSRTAQNCRAYLSAIVGCDEQTGKFDKTYGKRASPIQWAHEACAREIDVPYGVSRFARVASLGLQRTRYLCLFVEDNKTVIPAVRDEAMHSSHRWHIRLTITADEIDPIHYCLEIDARDFPIKVHTIPEMSLADSP